MEPASLYQQLNKVFIEQVKQLGTLGVVRLHLNKQAYSMLYQEVVDSADIHQKRESVPSFGAPIILNFQFGAVEATWSALK